MAAVSPPLPPPPPPPPPPQSGNQLLKSNHTPKPGHAAIPFYPKESPPVQETSPSSETLPDTEEHAPAIPQVPMENESQFSPSQGIEDHPSGGDEEICLVQETEAAPQILNGPQVTEVEDEVTSQLEQAGEDSDPEAIS